jgi:hypothetical protein
MRRWRIIFVFAVLIAVVAIAVTAILRPARSVTLADGTILRIEKVSYGKREPFKAPDGFVPRAREFLISHLPKKWANRFPKPLRAGSSVGASSGIVHTNSDALHIWLSRWDPTANGYDAYDWISAEIVDDHDCVFPSAQGGNEGDPTLPPVVVIGGTHPKETVNWLTFEAFPRQQKQFRLRIYSGLNSGSFVAEFIVQNPLAGKPVASNWPAQSIPVTVRDNDVAFTLKSMSYRTNFDYHADHDPFFSNALGIIPAIEVTEQGLNSSNWFPVTAELWDSSGNFARKKFPFRESLSNAMFLCPSNVIWRLSVKFCGLSNSPAASNGSWEISGLKR